MNGKYHKDRKINCKICNKPFLAGSGRARYCSNECYNINRRQKWSEKHPKEKSVCLLCNKVFVVYRNWQKFCSRKCGMIYNNTKGKRCAMRFAIFNRDKFCCQYCGQTVQDGAKLQIDHIIPKSQGGTDNPENLITSCWECNMGKTAFTLEQINHRFGNLRKIK